MKRVNLIEQVANHLEFLGLGLCATEEQDGQEITIALPTSKQVIASRLSLTPETLSRVFHDLATARLISVHGKQITVHDVRRLRQFDLQN